MTAAVAASQWAEDRALWRGMQTGNETAVGEFVRAFYGVALTAVIRSQAKGPLVTEFAHDALVDVVLATRGKSTPAPANPRGYVARAVRHWCANSRRSRARYEAKLEVAEFGSVSQATVRASHGGLFDDVECAGYEPPMVSVEARRWAALVERKLRPDELEILTRRADGWTFTELAAATGVNSQALRVRVTRLRRRLGA